MPIPRSASWQRTKYGETSTVPLAGMAHTPAYGCGTSNADERRTSKLIAKVERFTPGRQLFAPAEPGWLCTCALLFRGADSMALLRVLLELRALVSPYGPPCQPTTACGETADRRAFVRGRGVWLGYR